MGSSNWNDFLSVYVGQRAIENYRGTQSAEDANVPPTTQPTSRFSQRAPITQHAQTPLHEPTPLNALNPLSASTAQHVPTGPFVHPPPSSSAPLAPPRAVFPMAPPPARISPRPFTRPIPENIRISRPSYLPPHQLLPETINPSNPQTGIPSQPQITTGSEATLRGPGSEQKQRVQGPWRFPGISSQESSRDVSHGIKHRTNPDQNMKKRKQGEPPPEDEWHELVVPAYDGSEPRPRENIERELEMREENLKIGYDKRKSLLGAVSRLENSINVEESRIASIKKELEVKPK